MRAPTQAACSWELSTAINSSINEKKKKKKNEEEENSKLRLHPGKTMKVTTMSKLCPACDNKEAERPHICRWLKAFQSTHI